MKRSYFLTLSALSLSFVLSAFAQDGTKVIHKTSADEGDSSVYIETKKNAKILPDYEVISGEEEVIGDPTAGTKEAFTSWKEACKEWKKEIKENNKDGQVLVASCGSYTFAKDDSSGAGSGVYTYKSKGTYKVRVRIKDK